MSLAAGSKLGPYEILALIGVGGMGEVYRARDTKLKRDVAMKVLPEAFARDPERMARFQREAEVLASLNHPNIAHIHGIEERALVMELVEGETLASPLPVDSALDYAEQIAEALEYAHERGVIHRDLKPANIKVTPEGVVKLLDFGLAKAIEDPSGLSDDPANSPTLTLGATRVGVILGTAAYMSPEQASGKQADRRSDIWSFGAVLYEMLAGMKAFAGESVSDTLATVLKLDPDWDALPAETPDSIRKLVRRSLTKDRKQRLQAIGEARIVLAQPMADESAPPAPVSAPSPSRLGMFLSGAAVICFAAAVALAFVHFRERAPAPQVLQYTLAPPGKMAAEYFTISPDGRSVVVQAAGESGTQLWVRPLDSLQANSLPGTEGASYPFWSPDSRYIGFFADGKLKKVASTGGPPQTLCDAQSGRGGTWSPDGVIVFAPSIQGLSRVSAAGGEPVPLTKAEERAGPRFPVFLPDGRRFIYTNNTGNAPGIYLGSLDSSAVRRIVPDLSRAQYWPPTEGSRNGYLLFVREGTLMAQSVDPKTLDPAGDLFPVAEQIAANQQGASLFSLSPSGILTYQTGGSGLPTSLRQLSWRDRAGKLLKSVGIPGLIGDFALSPDGKRLAIERPRSRLSLSDLWVADLEHETESRLTFNKIGRAWAPVWSPDGSRIAFLAGTQFATFLRNSNGTGQEQVLIESKERAFPWDFSRDGKFLVVVHPTKGGGADALPLTGEGKPAGQKLIPLLRGDFTVHQAQLSPDGRWLAYASDESGKLDVYVQPFGPAYQKPPEGKWQISTNGGNQPRWRGDSRELFYQALDGKLMASEVRSAGATFDHQTPQPLFGLHGIAGDVTAGGIHYWVSADGKRFLVAERPEQEAAETAPLTVVVNWLAAVKKNR